MNAIDQKIFQNNIYMNKLYLLRKQKFILLQVKNDEHLFTMLK